MKGKMHQIENPPFELWKEGQLRTFNQLQASHGPLIQPPKASTPVRQVSASVRQAATYDSKELEKTTQIFQQMLLTDNLPWVPEQLKLQTAESRVPQIDEQAPIKAINQGPQNQVPRCHRGLNPEATEFHFTQINKQLSNTAASQARQSDVPARVGTMSAAIEQIKILENEVAVLKMALKRQNENCTCKKEESKWDDKLQNLKQFSDYASLGDSRHLEVDDGASSDLIEL